ncbi:MAG: hypothetical protein HYZ13_06360 [Acidobacteria bacterium]|nr:hypothetical protein [Acidobacteriota bacterium]
MRLRTLSALTLGFALPVLCAAQDWDGKTLAKGWARQDITGALTFKEGYTLRTWTKDGSLSGSLDISKVEGVAEFWLLDPWDNAWVVSGTAVHLVDKSGKVARKENLPALVADMAWDSSGFYLSYRTESFYLEKRDFKKGEVIWSAGTKPKKGEAPAPTLYRIACSSNGQLVMSLGADLNFTIFNCGNGKPAGQTSLALANAPLPALQAIAPDRLAVIWYESSSQVLAALPASQLAPSIKGNLAGLILAKVDFSMGSMELLATGLPENATLVGAQESEVCFTKPGGGLIYLKLK